MSTPLSPPSREAMRTDPSMLTALGPLGNAGSDSEGTGCTQQCQLSQLSPIPKRPMNPVIQNQLPKDWSRPGSGLRDSLQIDLTHDSCFLGFSFPSFHQVSSSSFSTILYACLAVRRQGWIQAEQMKGQRQERSSDTLPLLLCLLTPAATNGRARAATAPRTELSKGVWASTSSTQYLFYGTT